MLAVVALGGTSIRSRGACWRRGLARRADDLERQLVRAGRGLQDGDDEASAMRCRQPADVDLAEDADRADLAVLRGERVIAQQEGVKLDVRHTRRSLQDEPSGEPDRDLGQLDQRRTSSARADPGAGVGRALDLVAQLAAGDPAPIDDANAVEVLGDPPCHARVVTTLADHESTSRQAPTTSPVSPVSSVSSRNAASRGSLADARAPPPGSVHQPSRPIRGGPSDRLRSDGVASSTQTA